MQQYCSPADLIVSYSADRLVDLLDLATSTTAAQLEINGFITSAVASANSEVDSHVRAQYREPLPRIDPVLRSKAIDLAYFELVKRKPGKLSDTDQNIHDDAVAFLKRVAKGEVDLSVVSRREEIEVLPAVTFNPASSQRVGTLGSAQPWFEDL